MLSKSFILQISANTDGWLSQFEGETLFNLAETGPGVGQVVEIGTFVGKSLICLAGGSKFAAREHVTAIDPHYGSPEHQPDGYSFRPQYWDAIIGRVNTLPALIRNLEEADVLDWVQPIIATSETAAATWRSKVRLIFLDGDHRYEQVTRDLQAWKRWVCPAGLLAIHDYDTAKFPGVVRAIDEWLSVNPSFSPLAISDTIFIIQKLA